MRIKDIDFTHMPATPRCTFPTPDALFCLAVNSHLQSSNTVRVRASHNCPRIIGCVIQVATIYECIPSSEAKHPSLDHLSTQHLNHKQEVSRHAAPPSSEHPPEAPFSSSATSPLEDSIVMGEFTVCSTQGLPGLPCDYGGIFHVEASW